MDRAARKTLAGIPLERVGHPLIAAAFALAVLLPCLALAEPTASVGAGIVSGRVIGPSGKPLVGVLVSIQGDRSSRAATDSAGRFRITVRPGDIPEPPRPQPGGG